MPWQVPLALNIICTYWILPVIIKKSVGLPGRTQRLVLMFSGNAVAAWLLVLLLPGQLLWHKDMPLILLIGVINSFACYAHWRSADISLSRTSILAQGDDLIALALGYALLGETKVLRPIILFGVILCMGSAIALSIRSRQPSNGSAAAQTAASRYFLLWVALYCTFWGVAVFSQRYFGMHGVPVGTFLAGWYSGSIVGAIVVSALMGKAERQGAIHWQSLRWVLALCAATLSGLAFSVWAKALSPLTIVQPILQVSEMIFPTLIGLLIFNEAKRLTRFDAVVFTAGFAGSLILALRF